MPREAELTRVQLAAAHPECRDALPAYCTIAEAAVYAGRSAKHVWRAIKAHQLDAAQTCENGHWRIRREAVDRWLEGKTSVMGPRRLRAL